MPKEELKRRTRHRKLLQGHPLLLVQLGSYLVTSVAEATGGALAASAPGHPCQRRALHSFGAHRGPGGRGYVDDKDT